MGICKNVYRLSVGVCRLSISIYRHVYRLSAVCVLPVCCAYPSQKAMKCIYWTAQKPWPGEGTRDSSQSSVMEFYKGRSYLLTQKGPQITIRHYQTITQHSTCAICFVWGCFQPVGRFQQMITTLHACTHACHTLFWLCRMEVCIVNMNAMP